MTSQRAPGAEELQPRRWIALVVLLVASFMNMIDVTIVNVALPTLQKNLHADPTHIEWVIAAYVVAFALGLLPFGRLGDAIGRKRMFLVGVSLFTLFSGACGAAPSIETLIAARALQGLSGAMMIPQVLAIAQVLFPPRERAVAFSLFGLTAGLASVAGPVTGGLLISADLYGLDWRPIFLVNLPIGLLAIAAGRALIPPMPGHPDVGHDPLGVTLASLGVFLLVFPLIEGHSNDWPAWCFAMIAVAAIVFAIFYLHERNRHTKGRTQLLPLPLLNNGNFLLGTGMAGLFFSGVTGFFMIFAIYLQSGYGLTPLQSGLTTIPFPLGVLVASTVSGRLKGRWPRQRITVGALMLTVGMSLLYLASGRLGDTIDHWLLSGPLLVSGFGMGIAISSLFQVVLASVGHRDAGSGSGALQSFQQIGSAIGIAVAGQLFFSALKTGFASGQGPHAAFTSALHAALIYEIAAFVAVAALVGFLKPPAQAPVRMGPPVEA